MKLPLLDGVVGIHHRRGGFGISVQPSSKPCLTLTKGTGPNVSAILEDGSLRPLTVEEGKVLQGFPREFILRGTRTQCWARIGNSVPPPLMRAVAEHVSALIKR